MSFADDEMVAFVKELFPIDSEREEINERYKVLRNLVKNRRSQRFGQVDIDSFIEYIVIIDKKIFDFIVENASRMSRFDVMTQINMCIDELNAQYPNVPEKMSWDKSQEEMDRDALAHTATHYEHIVVPFLPMMMFSK